MSTAPSTRTKKHHKETVVMRQKTHDRRKRGRVLDATKRIKTINSRLSKFTNPITPMESFFHEGESIAADIRHSKLYKDGLLKATKVKVSPEECQVLLVVKNSFRMISYENMEELHKLGLKGSYHASIIPNTPENWTLCQSNRKNVFYGCPTLATLEQLVKKHGNMLNTVVEDTVDLDSARAVSVTQKITTEMLEPLSSNKAIEERLGYLGVICVEDIVQEMWSANADLLKHMAPFRLFHLKKTLKNLEKVKETGYLDIALFNETVNRIL